tara:strand:- start:5298 stop:6047 length:750 start_codon:yes stop_codon:yes gene_type:complete
MSPKPSKPAKAAKPLKPAKPPKPARVVPRRQRLAPEERRAQIIEAARALFAEGGVALVTMRSIAARVGITQAAIYQHFQDKEAILYAIAEGFFLHLIEAKERNVRADLDPIDRLRASMRSYVSNGLAHPEEYRLVFMTDAPGLRRHAPANLTREVLAGADVAEPEIQPTKGQIAYGHLQELVRELVAAGHIRGGDPETIAEAIWAAGHGLVTLLITHVDFIWDREKLIDTQINMLLNGLLPEDSPARHS